MSELQRTVDDSLSHVLNRPGQGAALAALKKKPIDSRQQVLDRFSQRFGKMDPHLGQSRLLSGGSSFHSRAFSLEAGQRPKHIESLFAKALIQ